MPQIPSFPLCAAPPTPTPQAAAKAVQHAAHALGKFDTDEAAAAAARVLRLETMIAARKLVDELEAVVPEELWTIATYKALALPGTLKP